MAELKLRMLFFGVDKLLDGKITLNGKVVNIQNEDAILGGLALIPENRKFDGLFFNFRASGNITAASLNSLSRFGILDLKREKLTTERLISQLEISTQAEEKTVNFLSGGNQQRL